ncbi:hypothetical protein A5667_24905 [Mycolicibacterium fortuitum]|uniref:hypothetical protein n=1 Tax=Mycolicibacterium fortuitum TaxID=1766 RepID=UPI0007ECF227|nr:hypothetical protein [Mycolicibacterium fortuitum]OBI54674.1 hypothetical protein A5667_24905 [Mycolicibacterium fortuitum]
MTIRKKPSAAEMLTRQLNSTKRQPAESIEDEFALAVARRLEERQIAKVPGVSDDQPEPQWYDIAIEMDRRHREYLADREAQRQAKQQAAQSTPDLIRSTLAGAARQPAPTTMPLNGSRVLRAALAGGDGTINSTRP